MGIGRIIDKGLLKAGIIDREGYLSREFYREIDKGDIKRNHTIGKKIFACGLIGTVGFVGAPVVQIFYKDANIPVIEEVYAQGNAHAAVIEDLAIFDFDVSCLNCTPEQKKMGVEIADKLAFYLRKNLNGVHVYRLKGYHHYSELPRSINTDGFIGGNLLLDSGNATLSAEYGDTFLIDIGNKSYSIPTHELELDNAILNLSDRISNDLGNRSSENPDEFFEQFFGEQEKPQPAPESPPRKQKPVEILKL